MADSERVLTLLGRIDHDWSSLVAHVEKLDGGALSRPAANDDGWPLSVVLAHVGRWEEWHRDAIAQHLADGSSKSYEGYDTWNEAWAAEDKALAPTEARARMLEIHERFRTLLGTLRPDQWDDAIVRWTETCTYSHYEEHVGDFASFA